MTSGRDVLQAREFAEQECDELQGDSETMSMSTPELESRIVHFLRTFFNRSKST